MLPCGGVCVWKSGIINGSARRCVELIGREERAELAIIFPDAPDSRDIMQISLACQIKSGSLHLPTLKVVD